MRRRRIVIFAAIASVTVAGGAALLHGMQAVAGHRHGGGYGGPVGLVCHGNRDAKLTKMTDKVTNWLDLTDDQQQNLTAVVQVVKDSNLEEFCPSGDRTQTDAPAKLAKLEQMMTRGLATVQEVQAPFNTFYASLSSEQQTKLDAMLSRRGHSGKKRADLSRRLSR